jgi:hypothetical protein
MIIAGRYSFNNGEQYITAKFPHLLIEIEQVVASIDANQHKTKTSEEKTMPGKMLFSPMSLNKAFKNEFYSRGWTSAKVNCQYPTKYYSPNYQAKHLNDGAFREMDFIKEKLGIEVQYGKYAFMVYNVCAKMTIFHNLNHIMAGVEIVPVKAFADDMSTGVSFFEQFVWDLETRGVSNIDIPVLILGLDEPKRQQNSFQPLLY